MSRRSAPISCTEEELLRLRQLASDPSNQSIARHASIVLACLDDGAMIKDIAHTMNERPNTVIMWKNRFAEHGISGLYNRPRGKQANTYGEPFMDRLLQALNEPPPEGASRWTGELLAKYLEAPPDVVFRYLRKNSISLRNYATSTASKAKTDKVTIEYPLQLTFHKETIMKSNDNIPENNMDLEFVARIIGKDGSVIERTVRIEDALPNIKDFDLSTKEGFLRDFDQYEQAVVSARNKIAEDITNEYLEEASKKNRSRKK